MQGLVKDALDTLETVVRHDLCEDVVYEGDGDRCQLRAIQSDSEPLLDATTSETRIAHDDCDWVCCAGDLVLLGRVAKPKPGHRITNTAGEIFEVLPKGGNECYVPSGRGRFLTIHTKRVQ